MNPVILCLSDIDVDLEWNTRDPGMIVAAENGSRRSRRQSGMPSDR
jgi:hypothetical protein